MHAIGVPSQPAATAKGPSPLISGLSTSRRLADSTGQGQDEGRAGGFAGPFYPGRVGAENAALPGQPSYTQQSDEYQPNQRTGAQRSRPGRPNCPPGWTSVGRRGGGPTVADSSRQCPNSARTVRLRQGSGPVELPGGRTTQLRGGESVGGRGTTRFWGTTRPRDAQVADIAIPTTSTKDLCVVA